MLIQFLILIAGLALIIFGANLLTDGASALAQRFGISDLVIGLTIVAFGTSAPELAISIISASKGSAQLAIGNVVGSNIFNICAIIGIVALVRPISVGRNLITTELPLVLLSSLALLAIGNGPLLDDTATPQVSRTSGILLLLFFAIFLRYTFSQARKASPLESSDTLSNLPSPPASSTGINQQRPGAATTPLWRNLLFIAAGLAALIFGAELFVDSAAQIATRLGVSEAIVGLTIVAAGTSLPELATSVTAAMKGNSGIAIGNVIGSNIFNIFLVLGAAATISPLPFGNIGNFDLITLTLASLLFWLFAIIIGHRKITRPEGALLTLLYITYTLILILDR